MKTKTGLAKAKKRRPRLGEPKVNHPPDPKKVLWCPYCNWKHNDSFTGRRRLGNHFTDDHYDEVAFDPGVTPPDFEE